MFKRSVIAAAACLLVGLHDVRPQSPENLSVVDLYQQALQRIGVEDYAGAEPYLSELIETLEPYITENPDAARAVEFARFHLGMAAYAGDRMDEALTLYDDYLAQYPAGAFTFPSRMMSADIFAARGEWKQVLSRLQMAMQDPRMPLNRRTSVLRMAGEALFRLEQWEPAASVMLQVFRETRQPDERMDAASYISRSLIALGRHRELFEFLPELRNTEAVYDIDLNISLIEAGDDLLDDGRHLEALQLYQWVLPRAELLAHVDMRLASLRERLDQPAAFGMTGAERLRRRNAIEQDIENVKTRRDRIIAYPDYEIPLQFRMGVCYQKMARPWEAYMLFRRLFNEHRDHELAEPSAYFAVSILLDREHLDRAVVEAGDYLDAFPQGPHAPDLRKLIVDAPLSRGRYVQAWRTVNKVRAMGMPPPERAETLFSAGYILIQMERWEPARTVLEKIEKLKSAPAIKQQALYWRAMSHLLEADYAAAREAFQSFLATYSSGGLAEDATFRTAVSLYGLGDTAGAESRLRDFIASYPDSQLAGEAFNMLGDIAAGEGRLDEAVAWFRRTPESTDDMTQINYAAFQQARMLELESRFDEIVDLFNNHIETYGVEGNPIEATYWKANAMKKSGRDDQALAIMYDTIERFGDQVDEDGIDMMIRDLIDEFQSRSPGERRTVFLERLYDEMEKARDTGRQTLNYRLEILFAEIRPEQRAELLNARLRFMRLEAASPLVLSVIGSYAWEHGEKERARTFFTQLLERYPQSDFSLSAYRGMASLYLAEGKDAEAEPLLEEISSRFARFEEAGWAMLRLADMHRRRGQLEKAKEMYETVLAVKEWRGPAWAEALYGVGDTLREQGNHREAFAFFQRVYVMYQGFAEWAARAYVASAECLVEEGRMQDAVNTCRELLNQERMKDTDAYREAGILLKRLEERLP